MTDSTFKKITVLYCEKRILIPLHSKAWFYSMYYLLNARALNKNILKVLEKEIKLSCKMFQKTKNVQYSNIEHSLCFETCYKII